MKELKKISGGGRKLVVGGVTCDEGTCAVSTSAAPSEN